MSQLLFFIIGLVIGGLMGIVMMCILQINSYRNENSTPTIENSKNENKE